jgi:hypothetical protein
MHGGHDCHVRRPPGLSSAGDSAPHAACHAGLIPPCSTPRRCSCCAHSLDSRTESAPGSTGDGGVMRNEPCPRDGDRRPAAAGSRSRARAAGTASLQIGRVAGVLVRLAARGECFERGQAMGAVRITSRCGVFRPVTGADLLGVLAQSQCSCFARARADAQVAVGIRPHEGAGRCMRALLRVSQGTSEVLASGVATASGLTSDAQPRNATEKAAASIERGPMSAAYSTPVAVCAPA